MTADQVHGVGRRPHVLHVVKVPPSDSGVAHSGTAMEAALRLVGDTTLIGLAVDAPASQRLRVVVGTFRRVGATLRAREYDHAIVELSGRALAEYWAAWRLLVSRRVEQVWIVAHDLPALVGPTFLFASLDRKGGRRIGFALSRTIGSFFERRFLGRITGVIVFAQPGADAFQREHPAVHIAVVPIPVMAARDAPKSWAVYVPARFDTATALLVLDAVARCETPPTVRFGLTSENDRARLEAKAREHGLAGHVEFVGYLDEDQLDKAYDDVAIVVRARMTNVHGDNRFAASGPIVSAMAAGCAVVTGDPRGSAACLADGRGVVTTTDDAAFVHALADLLQDPERTSETGNRARQHVLEQHTPQAVGHVIGRLWEGTPPS